MSNNDVLRKLKSLFVVEDPNAVKSVNKSKPTQPEPTTSPRMSTTPTSASIFTTDTNVTPDKKFVDMQEATLAASNLEGFDYIEFKNSLTSLANVIPDENVRYKSAYEMAKTLGVTKEKLVDSAQYYIQLLEAEYKKVLDSAEASKSKQVHDKQDEIKNLETMIAQKKASIAQINKDIAQAEQTLAESKSQATSALDKINATVNQYASAYRIVHDRIEDDLKKITTNL